MAIALEHFCTKTGLPIVVDGQPVTETIEHCLAEYFAPNATFKLGTVYPRLTTDTDLKQFENQGLTLQFAADDRFYFMDEQLRQKMFDAPHFGAAYGSNMFTPCKSFSQRENLRVLVVDASTGENGGVMPNNEAVKLVGDGDGKIDANLHELLGNSATTPFQTRFGIKERRAGLNADDETKPKVETWQLGKGTFAPRDLSLVGNGYDLVISTDQLKGRKNKENELGILGSDGKPIKVGNEIQPGEYLMTMGIGNKTDAYYGITSTGAQFWNSFPLGVEGDVLPRLERRLEELKNMANDPRKIAQDYIDSMDAKYKYQIQTQSEDYIDFENLNLGAINSLIDNALGSTDQDLMYRVLKADLDGHCQVLELPKVIDKLQEHWREQYMDCATGRFIKFDSAMAQTSHQLAENEVCYPNFPDAAEVIVYRGPTANSNTIDVYINRHLSDEPHDIGTIKMSPLGLKHSLSDCDGDRMAIALASEFPHTSAEIKERQQEQNRYAEIIKLTKKAYEGSFEQIALEAMENKVGLIANLCMKGIALENECTSIPKQEAWSLMRDISIGAVGMLSLESNSKHLVNYPPEIRKQIVELSKLCQEELDKQADIKQYNSLEDYNISRNKRSLPLLSEKDVDIYLEKSRKFYHDVVGILGGQLQIEVDRGKSANRSDSETVNACNAIIKNLDVAPWVEERKVDEVYATRAMNTKGHGAIDRTIQPTNVAFAESALVARSTQQFQDLFKGVEFTPTQKNKAVELKKTYDTLMNRAIEISREVEEAPGLRLIATSARGNAIEIIGLGEFKHPNAFNTNRKLDMMIVENNNPKTKAQNKWIAIAPVFDKQGLPELKDNGLPVRKKLGYVTKESATKYSQKMKQYEEFKELTPEVLPGLTSSQVRAAFSQVKEFAQLTKQSIPDSQKEVMAAAMWKVSTANAESREGGFKKTSAVFAMFGEQLIGRLQELQFTDFVVVGTHKPSNEHLGRKWIGEKVSCSIEQAPDPADPTQNKRWLVVEGKKLGVFRSESAQLPIGTCFEAEISSPPSASVIITSSQGNQLKVGQIKKYASSDREWQSEKGVVTVNVTGSSKALTPIALIDGKPLGVIDKESFANLSEKLSAKGIKIQDFQFNATLESAPATIANIKIDSETVTYPEVWTKEEPTVMNKLHCLTDTLTPLLKKQYTEKAEGLLHDGQAGLKAYLIPGEEFEKFMQEKNQNAESIKALSDEVEKKFGTQSFIGIAQKDNVEELYFGILIPTERSKEKIANRLENTFNFPLEYEQMQSGQRTKLIAIPLDDMQELISNALSRQQHRESAAPLQAAISPLSGVQRPLETVLLQTVDGDSISYKLKVDPGKMDATASWLQKNGAEFNLMQPNSPGDRATFTIASIHDAALNKLIEKYPPQNAASEQQSSLESNAKSSIAEPLQQPSTRSHREDWEKTMLKQALASLKANPANAAEEIQTSTFNDGKYRVIHHVESETLRIVDETSHRGTVYKAHKGKAAQTCKFTDAEKENFLQVQPSERDSMHDTSQHKEQQKPKGWERE